jgi:hypothetical protein
MGEHNLYSQLENAEMPASGKSKRCPAGWLEGWGATVGNGEEGWAKGAHFHHTDAATTATTFYVNVGDKTTASWVAVQSIT